MVLSLILNGFYFQSFRLVVLPAKHTRAWCCGMTGLGDMEQELSQQTGPKLAPKLGAERGLGGGGGGGELEPKATSGSRGHSSAGVSAGACAAAEAKHRSAPVLKLRPEVIWQNGQSKCIALVAGRLLSMRESQGSNLCLFQCV